MSIENFSGNEDCYTDRDGNIICVRTQIEDPLAVIQFHGPKEAIERLQAEITSLMTKSDNRQ